MDVNVHEAGQYEQAARVDDLIAWIEFIPGRYGAYFIVKAQSDAFDSGAFKHNFTVDYRFHRFFPLFIGLNLSIHFVPGECNCKHKEIFNNGEPLRFCYFDHYIARKPVVGLNANVRSSRRKPLNGALFVDACNFRIKADATVVN